MSERKDGPPAPTRGVPVQLDRIRYLRYPLGVTKKIREEFGEDALSQGLAVEKFAKVVWYGLRGDDADLTLEQVEDLVDLEHLHYIVDQVRKAMGHKAKASVVGPQEPAPAADNASA